VEIDVEMTDSDVQGDWSDDGRSTGLLIANDADYKRAQMLVHQVKRLNSPNLIVTNHDASHFPSIRIPSRNSQPRYLKFDRILADVPCSGDGTARKNYSIWKDWGPGNALGLHSLQVRILVRAIQMLKVGGRTVYSTCSLNPVENEAVIATAIAICGGPEKVRLVDCSNDLPGLKRTSGLTSWRIMDKKGRLWDSWADIQEAINSESISDPDSLTRIAEGMFPRSKDQLEGIPLERCMRIYPHFQDTGGFFIAALEKLSEIKYNPTKSDSSKAEKKEQTNKSDKTAINGESALPDE
jgi:multisite-specific tRNA:(cytosine-C5)-methyltransferase